MIIISNNNLIIEAIGKKIIFNIPSSRIFTISKSSNITEQMLDELDKQCNSTIVPKKPPEIKEYRNLVISCAETCNLRCSYCFANAGTYHNGSSHIMNDADYDKLFEYIIHSNYKLKSICLFGGEPLLGLDYIIRFFKKLELYFKGSGLEFPSVGIVTNGTLINEKAAAFFEKYKVKVSISIDGDKETNDKNRFYKDRSLSVHDTIMKNMYYLSDKSYPLSAVATISREHLRNYNAGDYEKTIRHFKSIGFDNAEMNIADENIPLSNSDIEKIKMFAREEVDYAFEKLMSSIDFGYLPRGGFGVISSICRKKYIPSCPAGRLYAYYTSDGEFYPCQLYYSAKKKTSNLIIRTEHPICKNCFCVNICSAYCPGSSILINGSEDTVVESRCIHMKALVKQCIIRLSEYMTSPDSASVLAERILNYSRKYSTFSN